MDYATRVDMVHCLDYFVDELCSICFSKDTSFFHLICEVLTLHTFHDNIDVFLILECFNLSDHVGVIELKEYFHLLMHLSEHAFTHPLSRNDFDSILNVWIAFIFSLVNFTECS